MLSRASLLVYAAVAAVVAASLLAYASPPARRALLSAHACRLATQRSAAERAAGDAAAPPLASLCRSCAFAGTVYACGAAFDAAYYREESSRAGAGALLHESDEAAWQHWAREGFARGRRAHGGARTVKVVLMTKDEWPLVRDWVMHHAHLFGAENLYVIDGSSARSRARRFLAGAAARLGVAVFWMPAASLEETGEAFNAVLRSLRWSADFVLKLDTDEFLGLAVPAATASKGGNGTSLKPGNVAESPQPASISVARDEVRAYIDSLPVGGESRLFKYQVAWGIDLMPRLTCPAAGGSAARTSVTGPTPRFSAPHRFWKAFVAAHALAEMDLGAHDGVLLEPFASLSAATPRYDSQLAAVHFHYPCFSDFAANTLRACRGHGYVREGDSRDEMIAKLEALTRRGKEINSWHKVADLLAMLRDEPRARAEYEARPPPGVESSATAPFTALGDLLEQLRREPLWLASGAEEERGEGE
jgi:hypothetical protein